MNDDVAYEIRLLIEEVQATRAWMFAERRALLNIIYAYADAAMLERIADMLDEQQHGAIRIH
jgi:hypothetical protein